MRTCLEEETGGSETSPFPNDGKERSSCVDKLGDNNDCIGCRGEVCFVTRHAT